MISVIRSGLDASMKQIGVLSNNIANARTTGFKKSMASFQDVYAQKASLLNPGKSAMAPVLKMSDPARYRAR